MNSKNIKFLITEEPLSKWITDMNLPYPDGGGAVTFEGRVRNINEGKEVTSLEYSSYESMARKVGTEIVQAAIKNHGLIDAFCVHRIGHLEVGEVAVWVIAISRHRKEAFRACEEIIDQVKDQVPVWKREHYAKGTPEWVACHRCAHPH